MAVGKSRLRPKVRLFKVVWFEDKCLVSAGHDGDGFSTQSNAMVSRLVRAMYDE